MVQIQVVCVVDDYALHKPNLRNSCIPAANPSDYRPHNYHSGPIPQFPSVHCASGDPGTVRRERFGVAVACGVCRVACGGSRCGGSHNRRHPLHLWLIYQPRTATIPNKVRVRGSTHKFWDTVHCTHRDQRFQRRIAPQPQLVSTKDKKERGR